MTKGELLALVRKTAESAAEQAGCELVDVEFVKEGGHSYLRVYIDKSGGVSLEDCEAVNGPVSVMLDEADPIEQAYFLEISSPGLERPLKTTRDFEKALEQNVEIRFYRAVAGNKRLEGVLEGFDSAMVTIRSSSGETQVFPIAEIAKINRVFDFQN